MNVLYCGNRRKTPEIHTLLFCFSCLIVISSFSDADTGCSIHKHDSSSPDHEKEVELLKKLEPLKGHRFNWTDGEYNYMLGICTDLQQKSHPGAGLVQRKIKNDEIFSLGSYSDVDIMAGTDWIFLTYYNGSVYGSHCNHTKRRSHIMVVCDPDDVMGEFRKVEERLKDDSDDCFYLFEVGSSVACSTKQKKVDPPHLSSGSTFCIILFTVAGIYLLLGFLYQRIVVGAKGLEQIPNYSFWRSFGNLQADGCDYVCRCGPRQESQAYRGIDDRIRTDEERDDQLLNM